MRYADQNRFFKKLTNSDGYIIVLFKGNNTSLEIGPSSDLTNLTPFAKETRTGILNFINEHGLLHKALHIIKRAKKENK